MNKRPYLKRMFWASSVVIGGFVISIIVCYLFVVGNASGRTFDEVDAVPHNRYGMLLATSPINLSGERNYYFDNRITAAVELYRAGKIDTIIASGGNYVGTHKYGCDEPAAIRDSLVAKGIPVDRIILDYEGVRTLNSVVKAKEVYKIDTLTFISQKFHNERAIYQADHYGLYTIGYNAPPSHIIKYRIKNTLREFLARPKMFLDLTFGIKPKFINGENADTIAK